MHDSSGSKTDRINKKMTTNCTFFNILTAQPELSQDPAFGESVIVMFRKGDEFFGFNIAGRRGKIAVHAGGPMNLGPLFALLVSDADYWTLAESNLVSTELLPIGQSGYGIAFVDYARGQSVDTLMGEKVMILDGYGAWGADQLRQEITTHRFWSPTSATVSELLSVPWSQRWTLARSKSIAPALQKV